MPVSMHKLLVHSSQIIPNFDLPIGYYSEEALEARNKDNKNFRLFQTRKFNRVVTMTDQYNQLLVSSDPIISTICKSFHRSNKKKNKLPGDAAKIAKTNESEESDNDNEEDEDEEIDKEVDGIDINNNQMEIDEEITDFDKNFEILFNIEGNTITDIENSDFYAD